MFTPCSQMFRDFSGTSCVSSPWHEVIFQIRWRIALMEKTIELLDFTEVDEVVHIHGERNRDSSSADC